MDHLGLIYGFGSQVFYLNNFCVYKTVQENIRPSTYLIFNSLCVFNCRFKVMTKDTHRPKK